MSVVELDRERILERLQDRWWRLNNLYKIVDKWGNVTTFQPNAVQTDLDDNLHYLNLVLKSRQHGVTTWACIRALDMVLFRRNCRCGIVAHTAGDAASFFRKKVLYAYDGLPDWLKKARPIVRRDMRDGVLELANGSSIEVSVSHRGGTLQFLHVSEYGPMCAIFPERAKEVASGALNTVATGNIVVIESTAYGASGDFYDRSIRALDYAALVRAGTATLTDMDYKIHFYGWNDDALSRMDPANVPISPDMAKYFDRLEEELDTAITAGQRAWYVKKSLEQGDAMMREYPSTPKEAFEASAEGAYYGKHMTAAQADGRIGSYPHNPGQPVHTFWDIGRRDATAIWFMQPNGAWYDLIAYYEASGEQSAHFAKKLQDYRDERGYVYGKHYMPHDIEVTEWVGTGDNRTRKQILEDLGTKPIVVVPRIQSEIEGIDMLRRILHRCRFDAVLCGPPRPGGKERGGIDAIKNFRKDFNEQTQSFRDTPRKDWTNHGADALRQMAQAFVGERPARKGARQRDENWKTN